MWIEPVRDWNKYFEKDINFEIYVWIEPVRDWNIIFLKQVKVKKQCELNLWGIETIIPKKRVPRPKLSVNWTCEGLKL